MYNLGFKFRIVIKMLTLHLRLSVLALLASPVGLVMGENIRIHHECESGIGKSAPRITDWYHEAYRVMTNGDREGRIFLFHPHTNNGFFFLLTNLYLIFFWKNMKKNFQTILNTLRCNMVT